MYVMMYGQKIPLIADNILYDKACLNYDFGVYLEIPVSIGNEPETYDSYLLYDVLYPSMPPILELEYPIEEHREGEFAAEYEDYPTYATREEMETLLNLALTVDSEYFTEDERASIKEYPEMSDYGFDVTPFSVVLFARINLTNRNRPWKYQKVAELIQEICHEDLCNDTYGRIRMYCTGPFFQTDRKTAACKSRRFSFRD